MKETIETKVIKTLDESDIKNLRKHLGIPENAERVYITESSQYGTSNYIALGRNGTHAVTYIIISK
jgi:hypothetical protein